MIPNNFVLANFANRKTCLYTQHQNIGLKPEKMLKTYNKVIPVNPEVFARYINEKTISVFSDRKEKDLTLEIWRKMELPKRAKKKKKENGNGQTDM